MTYTESKLKTQHSTSSQSGEGSKASTDPDKNIWSDILQDVQNSTKKTPPVKSVILLGDNESGRSTLIARMKGVDNISKGIGLEYHYIEINNEEDRDGKWHKIIVNNLNLPSNINGFKTKIIFQFKVYYKI